MTALGLWSKLLHCVFVFWHLVIVHNFTKQLDDVMLWTTWSSWQKYITVMLMKLGSECDERGQDNIKQV